MAKKQPQERRNETVQSKVTRTERKQLEQRAEREQITLSDAVRQAILRDLGATSVGRPNGRDPS